MDNRLNILYDELDIILDNLELCDKIALVIVNKFFNNKINLFQLKIILMNKKLSDLQKRKKPNHNICINDGCNIKYITNFRQKVLGLIDANQLYNVNKQCISNTIRYIPYCICCTNEYIVITPTIK